MLFFATAKKSLTRVRKFGIITPALNERDARANLENDTEMIEKPLRACDEARERRASLRWRAGERPAKSDSKSETP